MGTVVGGAMFGDNLSMISDTTIVCCSNSKTRMKDKFKVNFDCTTWSNINNYCLILPY